MNISNSISRIFFFGGRTTISSFHTTSIKRKSGDFKDKYYLKLYLNYFNMNLNTAIRTDNQLIIMSILLIMSFFMLIICQKRGDFFSKRGRKSRII